MLKIKQLSWFVLLLPLLTGCNNSSSPGTPVSQVTRIEFRKASVHPKDDWEEMKRFNQEHVIYVAWNPILTNKDIAFVAKIRNDVGGNAIAITFTKEGARKMAQFTSENIGSNLAIIVDDTLIVAPHINAVITDRAMITGDFTEDEIMAIFMTMTATEVGPNIP
ncbi:MAG: hypothetical protein COA78_24010 [Blastopirellula sp.]|nr:MAG: hypothetical protein COA78_24010 [Blastopirellula sp.]